MQHCTKYWACSKENILVRKSRVNEIPTVFCYDTREYDGFPLLQRVAISMGINIQVIILKGITFILFYFIFSTGCVR
jgi:hypothetical protein